MDRSKGAFIERGVVLEASNGKYKIKSLDRDGIETPPIGAADTRTYSAGDRVYFFLFPDGTGRILCPMA